MPRSMTICRKISSIPIQIEDIIQMINDMGIQVMEEAPDADDLMLAENTRG
ncbi:RNA polymerase sigma factor RpoD [Klebsiella pneumoniae subsp. rhinoscleromatis]|nr:RNA polymerase sigma factor RpoD [Klebsiella pneumoniae subsp. rhinoscleromatis]